MKKIIILLFITILVSCSSLKSYTHSDPTKTTTDFERDKKECQPIAQQAAVYERHDASVSVILDELDKCLKRRGWLEIKDVTWNSPIEIKHLKDKYELTVSASQINLKIPKGDLVSEKVQFGGATNSPGYFNFRDDKADFSVSGWFEPAERYFGIRRLWETEKKGWAQGNLPSPTNVSFDKKNFWDIIFYTMNGRQHLRACYSSESTWVDLHISLNSADKDARLKLFTFLNTVKIEKKVINK